MGFLLTEFEDFLSHVKIRKIPCWCKLLAGWSLKGNRHVFGKTKKILNFAFIKPNVPEKMTIWTLVNINLQDTMSAFNEEYFLVCETFEVRRVYSSRAVNVIWLFAFTPVNTAERFAAMLDEDPGSLGDFLTDRSDKQIRSPACFFPLFKWWFWIALAEWWNVGGWVNVKSGYIWTSAIRPRITC